MSPPGPGETSSGVAPILSESARQLFEASLPERPWCSNRSHGRYPRVLPKLQARRYLYIQPQPPWLRVWLNFDYDRKDAWCAADEVGLPAPTLAVINPENGARASGLWARCPGPSGTGEQRQAEALPRGDRTRHGGAARCRPELSRAHVQEPVPSVLETLSNDHSSRCRSCTPGSPISTITGYRRGQVIGVGRNVETFDATRRWAYQTVGSTGWTAVRWTLGATNASAHAEAFTVARHVPALDRSECRWIGRSVGRWTWERVTEEWFSEQTARRGRASGASRRAARGGAQPAHSGARGFRDDVDGNPDRDRLSMIPLVSATDTTRISSFLRTAGLGGSDTGKRARQFETWPAAGSSSGGARTVELG